MVDFVPDCIDMKGRIESFAIKNKLFGYTLWVNLPPIGV